jgi:hypothetical protein
MVLNTVRDYLHELRTTKILEWKLFQKFGKVTPDPESDSPDLDLRRLQTGYRSPDESTLTQEYKNIRDDTLQGFAVSDFYKNEPFEFFIDSDPSTFPTDRNAAPGIKQLPARFHKEQVVTATDSVPESGFKLHPLLRYLVYRKYPQYIDHVEKYTRPLGTTDATFSDFNKEQKTYPPVEPCLIQRIVPIVRKLLNARKFLPLHYVDTFFIGMPLHTGTSYFYRHSYELRTHAAFAHSKDYSARTTSKGYFLNSFTEWARTVVHRIKQFGLPFDPTNLSETEIRSRTMTFFMEHATMLFTRNHISDRDGILKQRPVYAMDTLFLHLEAMLTFPLHIMARSMSSSIMYSLETIRGGCNKMDNIAQHFRSFLCIDWSSFDQRMPWIIVDTFFTVFLPSLLVVSAGYQPTHEYPTYPDLTTDTLFTRTFNLLCFLRLWYYNAVFTTADGFAYVRTLAGIASGMLNTQYLDSYCNLFLIIHALLHYSATEDMIFSFCIFVMGDDNVVLTRWNITELNSFLQFFEAHALNRFGMVLSRQKSIITTMRTRIEMLGYQINAGRPKRPLGKLVAQLCYPEHGPIDKYMSSRAVGMAWASAGMDRNFYLFCQDVYHTFLPYAETPDKAAILQIQKHLPGMFKMLDSIDEFVNPERFPALDEIQARFRTWQGELSSDKKWSPAHFIYASDVVPLSSVTMADYMSQHDIQFPEVTQYFSTTP